MRTKRLLIECFVVVFLSLVTAGATWMIRGGEEKSVACDPETLQEGQICYRDAEQLTNVLWVDARERTLWKKNGLPGSIFVSEQGGEDVEELIGEAAMKLFEEEAEAVVIYCATEGCGSSEAIAQKFKELDLIPSENIYVLAGGWKALGL